MRCISLVSGVAIGGFETISWLALIALGLIPQVVGWLTINQALGYISPAVAAVSLLSQTVFTAIFPVPVLGEMLTVKELLGGSVVLTGIYLVNSRTLIFKRKKKQAIETRLFLLKESFSYARFDSFPLF